jgi:hypothetical protein
MASSDRHPISPHTKNAVTRPSPQPSPQGIGLYTSPGIWYITRMHFIPTTLEKRLKKCYSVLVKGFGKSGSASAAGPGATVGGMRAASFAQKLWRFCCNPRIKASALIEPMHMTVRQEVVDHPGEILLAVHDWSTLSFGGHESKKDRVTLTHANDVGYDLASVLIVRGSDGATIAPVAVSLTADDVVHSTHDVAPSIDTSHVDQVLPNMRYTRDLNFGPTVVHVIDRELDSVGHWRQWSADGHLALVRADNRIVLHQGKKTTLEAVADQLRSTDSLKYAREVLFHGRKALQFVAEAEVVLYRPATRHIGGGKKIDVPGPPLTLRLVVSEVRDFAGRLLARWLLLTNVPVGLADAAMIALWYYFRWRIETMHKLIKSAGSQLESWLQRNGHRILIKLLLAFGACVSVWALEEKLDEGSETFKKLLMELSGRQTKRTNPITTSGMLAGLWVLQAALAHLACYKPEQLNAMLQHYLPLFAVLI